VGWWWLWHRARRFALISSVLFASYSVYAIGYDTTDSQAYLIPAFFVFALWLAWGLNLLLGELQELIGSSRSWVQPALPLALALVIPLVPLVSNYAALDLSADDTAHDYGLEALEVVAPDAILVTQTDPHTFTLWYMRYGEGRRADVAVLAEGLLPYRWYRRTMADVHPDIAFPSPSRGGELGGHAISAWAFAALFEANRDHHPIYVTEPDARIRDRYHLSEVGPIYRVVGLRES
jgi:hypothetical protein